MSGDARATTHTNGARIRIMRRVTIVFFAAFAVFVTWPGVLPFRGPGPFVLGLPFPLVWVTLWILGALVVLVLLDRAYRPIDDAAPAPATPAE